MSDEKRCARRWKRDLEHAHRTPHLAVASSSITRTALFSIVSVPVTNGQLVRVPATGGNAVPTNLGFNSVEIQVNLSTAVKEASGNTLSLQFYMANGQFIAGINWTSYGKQYISHNPDGTTTIDPDPAIQVPLANLLGQQVYLTYQANGIANAGVSVNGIS
jgi:hypothetical protein